jgi:two-component system, chemotaxis family, sensor histidine kinase and response regulator PixL
MMLRAVHSLEGAAGITEYEELRITARRLEASLQIIKSNQPLIIATERLLLNAVGLLREIITINRQGKTVDPAWLKSHNRNIFEPLEIHLKITESRAVENIPKHDLISIIFEQEIDEMLGKLELKLDAANPIGNLDEELQKLAVELADLGEMLELSNFVQLNMAIAQSIQSIQTVSPDQISQLAVSALRVWRRSQALVFDGNQADIPATFDFEQFDLDLNDQLDINDLFLLEDDDNSTSLEKAEELELEALLAFDEEGNDDDSINFESLEGELELDHLLAFAHEEFSEEFGGEEFSEELTILSTADQEKTDKSSILLTELESVLESFNPFDVVEIQEEDILNSEVVVESNTIRIVLIEVNQMILAIPTNSIQEVIRYVNSPQGDRNSPILHQNSFIPIFSLDNYLQINYPQSNTQSDRLQDNRPPYTTKSILILNQGQMIWGIYVNGCWGEQEVTLSVATNMAETIPKIFTGYAIATNEKAVPILNMQTLTADIMEG